MMFIEFKPSTGPDAAQTDKVPQNKNGEKG